MPNETDVFFLRATVGGIPAEIDVNSESSYQELDPGSEYTIGLTFRAGAKPEATLFGVYFFPTSALRSTAQGLITDSDNDGTEPTITGQSSTAPSTAFTPGSPVGAGSARSTVQIDGTLPVVTATTDWFGLVAIYQDTLETS